MTADAIFQELEKILGSERLALRTGGLSGLGPLVVRKANLISQLRPTVDNLKQLEALRRGSERNQALVSAALNGVRAAQARIRSIMTADQNQSVYDRHGHSRNLVHPQSGLERRA